MRVSLTHSLTTQSQTESETHDTRHTAQATAHSDDPWSCVLYTYEESGERISTHHGTRYYRTLCVYTCGCWLSVYRASCSGGSGCAGW